MKHPGIKSALESCISDSAVVDISFVPMGLLACMRSYLWPFEVRYSELTNAIEELHTLGYAVKDVDITASDESPYLYELFFDF